MNSNSVLLDRANLLLDQNRVKDAIQEIKNYLKSNPEDDHAYSIFARCYYKLKDFDQGIQTLREAIRINPQNGYYFYLLGFGFLGKGQLIESRNYFQQGINLEPYQGEYYGMLGRTYLRDNQYNLALEKANKGLELDPENINALNTRAIALNKLKQADAAIDAIESSLRLDPENDLTHSTYGWNLLERGKHKDANIQFRESLRINPLNDNAREGLKESLKSKFPPYKWMLQYSFWMQNKGKGFTRFVPIGLLILVRIFAFSLNFNNSTKLIGAALIATYFLFVMTSWIVNPIANFLLLFHRDGKYALSITEKWTSILVVSAIFLGTLNLIITILLFSKGDYLRFGIPSLIFFLLTISVSQLEFPLQWRGTRPYHKIALVTASLGILSIGLAYLWLEAALFFAPAFLLILVLSSWFKLIFKRRMN